MFASSTRIGNDSLKILGMSRAAHACSPAKIVGHENHSRLKPRPHVRFFMPFFLIVTSPARGKNRMCSHPRTGDATAEKTEGKISREFQ